MANAVSFSLISSHLRLLPTPTSELPANTRPSFCVSPFLRRRKIGLTTVTFSSVQLRKRPTSASMTSHEVTPLGAAMSGDPKLLLFDGEEELSDSLAKYTADLSKKFCLERGAFTVVLSGGSLVKSLRF